MKKLLVFLTGMFLVALVAGNASATSFEIGNGGDLTFGGLGVGSYTSTALSTPAFSLAVGETSDTLNFFDISFNPIAIGGGSVTGTIEFLMPTLTATDDGNYWGVGVTIPAVSFFGYTITPEFTIAYGDITWGDPLIISYGNGGSFKLDLFDIEGFTSNNLTIQGTIENISDSAPVPEPATMMLFGIGLLGLAGVSRKKS